jgi:tetratricopeptide (TPR) repeat protein
MKQWWRTALVLLIMLVMLVIPTLQLRADPYTRVMRRGNRYYRNGLYREALGYFEEGQGKNEKSVVPHFNRAAALYKMEDYVRSVESLTEALKYADKDGEIANIHYNLGNSHFQLGSFEKAVEHYIEALEKNPHDLNTKFNLELALERLSNQTASGQEEVQDDQDKDGKQPARGDIGDEGEQEGSEGEQEPGEREFSQEEARRLVDAVNNDQSQILNEIIQNRAGKVQHERDW